MNKKIRYNLDKKITDYSQDKNGIYHKKCYIWSHKLCADIPD